MKLISDKKVLLKDFVTFDIGGHCEHFVEVFNLNELKEALDFSRECGLPFLILGQGSNLLVSDSGFKGVVIKISMKEYKFDGQTLIAQAGVHIGDLVEATIKRELSGLEWASGLPGSLGGAVRGNAGAFGWCMADIVNKVTYLDTDGNIKELSKSECMFKYRDSFFKHNPGIITQVEIILKGGKAKDIKDRIFKNVTYRVSLHPIDFPNAGSIFKNIEDSQKVKMLLEKDPKIKDFLSKWNGKVSAAYLIEEAGMKGRSIGGAQVSFKHANFIINKDGASACDVLELIKLVRNEVFKKFELELELEIQFVGLNLDEKS